ncbi:MAG TPA: biopolymer transporter ExbD [Planctomycetota bacterium]|nr:biopolymer transporter ExbD [Planctomycetota bacterium]
MVMGAAAEDVEIKQDMTPMIDVVFQLMIFFMCTIKFKVLEGKLAAYLPKDVGVNPTPPSAVLEKVEIVIKVLKEGKKLHPVQDTAYVPPGPFRYGPDRQLQFQVNASTFTEPKDLAVRLKQLHDAQPTRAVTIDPRGKPMPTTYADILMVLNLAVLAGFNDITFKGSYED